MPRSEGGSTMDQDTTEQTQTERVMEQRRGERGGQDTVGQSCTPRTEKLSETTPT